MLEYISTIISFVCQISIILFVLKEFGIIASGLVETKKETVQNAQQPMDLSGLLGNVQGMLNGLQTQTQQLEKTPAPTIEDVN